MENNQTETLKAPTLVLLEEHGSAEPPTSEKVELKPDVSVALEGVEVAVTDTTGGLHLTPVTGFVGVLLLGLLAVVVARLRKK